MTLNAANLTTDLPSRIAMVNDLEAAAVTAERARANYVFAKDEERAERLRLSLAANEALHRARMALIHGAP